ncbi:hypothetical protein NBRC116494_21000 [Aurantivibrio plasticivorans]
MSNNVAVTSIRQQLELTRKKHNRLLFFAQASRWLFGIAVLFVVWLPVNDWFEAQSAAQLVTLGVWVLLVFLLTFWCAWCFLKAYASKQHFAYKIEEHLPDLQQRLITSLEFQEKTAPGVSPQLLAQLWLDAERHANPEQTGRAFSVDFHNWKKWYALGVVGLLGIIVLLNPVQTMLIGLTDLMRTPATPVAEVALPIGIQVNPGDVTLQRGDDLTISAQLQNSTAQQLILFVQDDQLNWRRYPMYSDVSRDESHFSIQLNQLTQDVKYYVALSESVDADNLLVKSKQYQVELFDLPRVTNLTVRYQYPEYTRLENKSDDPGGDILAPMGTKVQLDMTFNKPIVSGRVVLSNGESIPLSTSGENSVTDSSLSIEVKENLEYAIEVVDALGYQNKNPLEYYIRAIPDEEPSVVLKKPGKDQEVMPLEEVSLEIEAKDDYGLTDFYLTYSVVGSDDKVVQFLDKKAAPVLALTGEELIYLEDLNAQPGDVISYSVTATDNNGLTGPKTVVSDIYFLEVTSTDHQFSKASSGMGGGGGGAGGGGNSSALVKTQKDIIAATWKLKNRQDSADLQEFAADTQIIRSSQAEVADRAQMSISRLTERGNYQNDSYQRAVEALQQAIGEMQVALEKLDELSLSDALQNEQKALQHVLRAEAQINRTQVAMNRNQSGGGGGGQQRDDADVRELFEMELGELENRYELPQQQAQQSGAAQQNETVDKLAELAKRQERLTRSQRELARRENQMTEEQKRQQLQTLQRQQEQLRRELQQLAQQMQRQQQSQQSSSQQSSQNQQQSAQRPSSQQASQANNSAQSQQQAIQQALTDAAKQMEEAAQSQSLGQAAAKSQKALDGLRKQADALSGLQEKSIEEMQDLAKQQVERLVEDQQALRQALEALSREQSMGNTRSESARAEGAQQVRDQQASVDQQLDDLMKGLRDISRRNTEQDARALEQAHELVRSVRPIQEKKETSKMILKRGMVNLSLRLESEVEDALEKLQTSVQQLGRGQSYANNDVSGDAAAQVSALRRSIETLQQQIEQQQIQQQSPEASASQQAGTAPATSGVRQGERSGALSEQQSLTQQRVSQREMQQTFEQTQQLARDIAQAGRASGGQIWSGNARSIESQLTEQGLADFLNRPALLRSLLNPVIELENQLRLASEFDAGGNALFSPQMESIPEKYKTFVENYYRGLSEERPSATPEIK